MAECAFNEEDERGQRAQAEVSTGIYLHSCVARVYAPLY